MPTVVIKDSVSGTPRHMMVVGEGTESNPYRTVNDVYVQDQTSNDISLFLAQSLDESGSINANTSIDQETVTFTFPGQTPVVGNFVCMKEGVQFSQLEVLSVNDLGSNVYEIGLSMPLDFAYTTAASVCLQNVDINKDGSTTPIEYFVSPKGLQAGEKWHMTRIIVSMIHGSAGDDARFGDIAGGITKGLYFRKENGTHKNLFNIRTNGDLRNEGYDVTYPPRSGAQGDYGTASRITFNGKDKRGVVIPLDATNEDKLMIMLRDDLSALGQFRIKIHGHVVD